MDEARQADDGAAAPSEMGDGEAARWWSASSRAESTESVRIEKNASVGRSGKRGPVVVGSCSGEGGIAIGE